MIKLSEVPHGIDDINYIYGNPDTDGDWVPDRQFYEDNIVIMPLPFPLRLAWGDHEPVRRIALHAYVVNSALDAFQEIGEYKGIEYLKENNLDLFGGGYFFRKMSSGNALSAHSWGIALDFLPHLGSMGKKPKLPEFIVNAFKSRGWNWGGDWPNEGPYPYDGMHFQACTGY